jgi:hypothetical protein
MASYGPPTTRKPTATMVSSFHQLAVASAFIEPACELRADPRREAVGPSWEGVRTT